MNPRIFLTLFSILLVPAFPGEKQVEGLVFVGGQARPAIYTVKSSQQSMFSREKYSVRSGKVVGVASPNTLRVQTPQRTEEVILIGMMDLSGTTNQQLRSHLMSTLTNRFLHREVKVFHPREYENWNLLPNHGFVISGNRLVQAELLEDGLGFSSHSKSFEPELMAEFHNLMQVAVQKGKGVFHPRN